MINRAIFNRAPLLPNELAPLPLGAITPGGWLREQLTLQKDGPTGQLADFWPSVRDSVWLGGKEENWERGPYYMDGAIPLAHALKDEKLLALSERFVEYCLSSAREDGYFGPEDNPDWWPRMVAVKALIQAYEATGDKRIPEMLYRYFAYQYKTLDQQPLKNWAVARGGENMQAVIWLYNLTGKPFLLKLLGKLREQTADWTSHFSAFPHTQPTQKLFPWQELKGKRLKEIEEEGELSGLNRLYYQTQYHMTHVVNVAMGLKTPGVVHAFKSGQKEKEGFRTGYEKLMKYHGVANGIFTGDEHLSGNSPVQGTELCAVAELMYTVESLLGLGEADAYLGDVLEKLAFNALPATFTPDMRGHQYVQQVNQVRATTGKHGWYNNSDNANIYGLEPNFGCCTANQHQAFPKYLSHLWYATRDNGFAAISYAPCEVRFQSNGTPVKLTVEGNYPFRENIAITVRLEKDASFPLLLRIPAWAEDASITLPDGEILKPQTGAFARAERVWHTGDVVRLHLPMQARITRHSRRSAAVEVGPLLMACQPEEEWKRVREDEYAPDWEVTARGAWNWALAENASLTVERDENAIAAFKHGKAVAVRAQMYRLDEWTMRGENCAPTPIDPELIGRPEEVVLVPYGDTSLRIAQFPFGKIKETE